MGSSLPALLNPGWSSTEESGGSREVEVSFFVQSPGKTVGGVKEASVQNGEPVEDIAGLGDAAIYRPQAMGVVVQKKSQADDLQWLEIRVYNVEGPDKVTATKRFAVELARLAVARY